MNDERPIPFPVTWTMVFAVNLIVPLLFGWDVTSNGGRLGMGGGILILWAFGLLVAAQARKMARALALGGSLVALAQMLLLLHAFAGSLALDLWQRVSGGGGLSEFGGFAVTVMTGGPLMVLAMVCGLVIDWLLVGPAADGGH